MERGGAPLRRGAELPVTLLLPHHVAGSIRKIPSAILDHPLRTAGAIYTHAHTEGRDDVCLKTVESETASPGYFEIALDSREG